jgi:hypothetical protein
MEFQDTLAAAKKGMWGITANYQQYVTTETCTVRCLFVCSGAGIEIAGVYNDRRSLDLQEAGM